MMYHKLGIWWFSKSLEFSFSLQKKTFLASLSFLFLSFLYFTASVVEDHALLSFSVRSLVRQGFGKPLFQGRCPGILSMQPERHQFHCHVHLCQIHISKCYLDYCMDFALTAECTYRFMVARISLWSDVSIDGRRYSKPFLLPLLTERAKSSRSSHSNVRS